MPSTYLKFRTRPLRALDMGRSRPILTLKNLSIKININYRTQKYIYHNITLINIIITYELRVLNSSINETLKLSKLKPLIKDVSSLFHYEQHTIDLKLNFWTSVLQLCI